VSLVTVAEYAATARPPFTAGKYNIPHTRSHLCGSSRAENRAGKPQIYCENREGTVLTATFGYLSKDNRSLPPAKILAEPQRTAFEPISGKGA